MIRLPALAAATVVLGFAQFARAEDDTRIDFGGDVRGRATYQRFPDDSAIQPLAGSSSGDFNAILRLKLDAAKGSWDFKTDGQVIAAYGESVEYNRELAALAPEFEALFGRLITDDRRWWNLTNTIEDEGHFKNAVNSITI